MASQDLSGNKQSSSLQARDNTVAQHANNLDQRVANNVFNTWNNVHCFAAADQLLNSNNENSHVDVTLSYSTHLNIIEA